MVESDVVFSRVTDFCKSGKQGRGVGRRSIRWSNIRPGPTEEKWRPAMTDDDEIHLELYTLTIILIFHLPN